jgi:hypothetical protein
MIKYILFCAMLGSSLACFAHDRVVLGLILPFFFFGWAIGNLITRKRVLKPHDERPFTSDELKQMGIVLPDPERYDCETFVR